MGLVVASQKTAHGELGNLTPVQHANLDTLQYWMQQARETAKLAFSRQTVKLHQKFQVGINSLHDLGSVLGRADIILASVQNPINLPTLKLKAWTDAETASFVAARGNFGTVEQAQAQDKSGAKVSTTVKNQDAADLYERLLTIQHAANLNGRRPTPPMPASAMSSV